MSAEGSAYLFATDDIIFGVAYNTETSARDWVRIEPGPVYEGWENNQATDLPPSDFRSSAKILQKLTFRYRPDKIMPTQTHIVIPVFATRIGWSEIAHPNPHALRSATVGAAKKASKQRGGISFIAMSVFQAASPQLTPSGEKT